MPGQESIEILLEKIQALEKEVTENQKTTAEILVRVRRINSWIFWQRFYIWLKIAIFILILSLAYWYIPPYLEKIFSSYQNIFSPAQNVTNSLKNFSGVDFSNINLNDPAIQNLLNNLKNK